MATIGRNMRLCVGRDLRSQTRAVYSGVLGCSVRSPEPDIEIFEFADGRNIGVFYVDPAEALTLDQHTRPIWLELEVEDVQATTAALLAAGARSFDYADKEHPYFQAPGGQIFQAGLLAAGEPAMRRMPVVVLVLLALAIAGPGFVGLFAPDKLTGLTNMPVDALNELRAVAGTRVGIAIFLTLAAWRPAWRRVGLVAGCVFFGATLAGRLASNAVDGMPGSMLKPEILETVLLALAIVSLWWSPRAVESVAAT